MRLFGKVLLAAILVAALLLLGMFLANKASAAPGRVGLEPIVAVSHDGDIELESEAFGYGGASLGKLWEKLDAVDWSLAGGLRAIVPVSTRVDLRGTVLFSRAWGETRYPTAGVPGAYEEVRSWRSGQSAQLSVRIWLGEPLKEKSVP